MKRFLFSLETLLSLRREQEQECEIHLASAVRSLVSVDNRIEVAKMAGEKAFLAENISIDDLRARERLWMKSQGDLKALEKPRIEALKRVDDVRKTYLEACSRRTTLEKLRGRRKEQWKTLFGKEELKRLDETAKGAVARRRLMGEEE